jgi:acyl carrier protein
MNELSEKIKDFIRTDVCPDLNLERIDDDESLIESGIVDSLGVLKILAFLDESFGIDLSAEEIKLENFRTIRMICALIDKPSA